MSAAVIAYQDDLAQARARAAERRRQLDEAPELTAEEIVSGFARALRSISAPGFGKVFYYYPLSLAEYIEVQERIGEEGSSTASRMVDAIIALALNSDGSKKFKPEHAAGLIQAPPSSVFKIANALVSSHRFTLASAEKK
jgi:hypothetical protein